MGRSFDFMGETYGETKKSGIQDIVNLIESNYFKISEDKIILDAGSGKGHAINYFKEITQVNKAIGIEQNKERYKESTKKYPNCVFYNGLIEENLDIVSQSDIIFTNNICFPVDSFWKQYDYFKPGSIIIYNNITLTAKMIYRYNYSRSDFNKISIESNNMLSEYHIFCKR